MFSVLQTSSFWVQIFNILFSLSILKVCVRDVRELKVSNYDGKNVVNLLNAKLNPSCKSQLAEFF